MGRACVGRQPAPHDRSKGCRTSRRPRHTRICWRPSGSSAARSQASALALGRHARIAWRSSARAGARLAAGTGARAQLARLTADHSGCRRRIAALERPRMDASLAGGFVLRGTVRPDTNRTRQGAGRRRTCARVSSRTTSRTQTRRAFCRPTSTSTRRSRRRCPPAAPKARSTALDSRRSRAAGRSLLTGNGVDMDVQMSNLSENAPRLRGADRRVTRTA